MKAAAAATNEIPEGKVLGESALCKATKQIEEMIRARGGYGTAKAIANKLIARPLFKRLMPAGAAAKNIDGKARDAIINAARGFLKDMMSTRGRRTTVNSNAFWVAVTALIPAPDGKLRRQTSVENNGG